MLWVCCKTCVVINFTGTAGTYRLSFLSHWKLKDDTHLSVQCDGTGLTLSADPLWPGRVTLTAWLNLAADVLQSSKLPSVDGGKQHENLTNASRVSAAEIKNNFSLISSTSQLANVRVEWHVLHWWIEVIKIVFVKRLEGEKYAKVSMSKKYDNKVTQCWC